MTDRIMDSELLAALNIQRDFAMGEALLVSTLTALQGRPVPPERVRQRLQWLKDRGYVASRADDYGADLWFITQRGVTHLQAAR
jgi:hypothetical protein